MRPIDADRLKAVLEKNFGHTGGASVLEQLIDEQPTIEPSTNCSEIPNSSDTISRQAAIDALDKRFDNIPMEQTAEILKLRKDLRELPTIQPEKAQLSQEGTTFDTISRQAAIDALVQCTNCGDEDTLREYVLKHSLDNGWTGGILEALDAVKDLPPVQPEPQEGHWIKHESLDGGEQYECSRCGVLWEFNDGTPEDNEANFCPKCGTKMKGEANE